MPVSRLLACVAAFAALALASGSARAQMPGGPPAVGVVKVAKQPQIDVSQFIGRIQAINRVDIVARVTAFLEQQRFVEGSEVQKGDLLYTLERGPFEADVAAKQATVQQQQALLRNAALTLGRAQALLNTPAGQRSTVDDALAQQASQSAQYLGAQAQLRVSQINLDYTEIKAPVSGLIGRTNVTIGNVVGPSSGTLTTIVSQDPMYVSFPVSVRAAVDLRDRYSKQGFREVQLKVKLPNGKDYGQTGKLDFVNNTIDSNTDTIMLRGVIPNPLRAGAKLGDPGARELTDGEFITVLVESVEPIDVLAIPRAAVLTNQQGDFAYVVGADNKAEMRKIQLGQSSATTAVVLNGLKEGESVVAEGLQKVRPGAAVAPGPMSPAPPSGGPPAAPPGGTKAAEGSPPAGSGSGPASGAASTPASGAPANR